MEKKQRKRKPLKGASIELAGDYKKKYGEAYSKLYDTIEGSLGPGGKPLGGLDYQVRKAIRNKLSSTAKQAKASGGKRGAASKALESIGNAKMLKPEKVSPRYNPKTGKVDPGSLVKAKQRRKKKVIA